MKRITLDIYVLLSGFSFSACSDFCCDCDNNSHNTGTGNFRLVRDWGGLWQGMEKPEISDVYFYHPTQAPRLETVYYDTTYFNITVGKYHVLTVNSSAAGMLTGMEDYTTAQIVLPLEVTDSNIITCEAPFYTSDHVITAINSDGVTECTVTPLPGNKIINFQFKINSPVVITSCRAKLDGVQTSKMLYVNSPVYAYALLPFETQKTNKNDFYKSVSILGLAPGTVPLLTVLIECDNGISEETVIDLTDKINFQSSPVQNCTIKINISANDIQTDVVITDWEPGIDGNIEFH